MLSTNNPYNTENT